MNRHVLFALCLVALPRLLPAQAVELGEANFESVGDAESIPDNNVSALAEDHQGFLWIGTPAGLLRYDGYRFERMVRGDGDRDLLSGLFIRALLVAQNGRLWIGTDADGVWVYEPKSGRSEQFRHDAAAAGSLTNDTIQAFAEDSQHGIWIGTRGGLDHWRPGGSQFEHYRHRSGDAGSLSDDRVDTLLVDRHGDLWIGNWSGLNRLRLGTSSFEAVHSDSGRAGALAGKEVVSLFEAADGRVWIGTSTGVAFVLDTATLQLDRLGQDPRAVARSSGRTLFSQPLDDEVWMARYGGIDVLAATGGRLLRSIRYDPASRSGLTGSDVRALLRDRSGLLWIGGYGGGLQRIDPHPNGISVLRFSATRSGALTSPSIGSVLERDDGTLWIGTQGNGIDVFDRERGVVAGFRPNPAEPYALPGGRIRALAHGADGGVWVGMDSGLVRYDAMTRDFRATGSDHEMLNTGVRCLLPSRSGALWIGSRAGLARWSPVADRIDAIAGVGGDATQFDIDALAEDADGRLWVGTPLGLFTLDPGATQLTRVQSKPSGQGALSHPSVVGLLFDRSGRLWVDTSLGLNRMRHFDGQFADFEQIGARFGIGGRPFGANLLADAAGRIWTSEYVFDPASDALYPLNRADGVDIGTPWFRAYTQTRDGLMLFGGSTGLLIIDPTRFRPWTYSPPLVVSELKIDNVVQPGSVFTSRLILAAAQRGFSLEFAALDFTMPERNRYQYRLEGYDADWIASDADHRVASYANLMPGDYALQIRGSNRSGTWSPHELRIPVRVLPAYWQTYWFAGLVLLAAFSGGYGGFRWRTAHIRQRADALERLVEQRTAQLGTANSELTAANLGLASAHTNLSTLSAIGRELTTRLDLDAVLENLYQQINQMLDASVFGIGLYHPERGEIEIRFALEEGQRYQPYTRSMADKNQLAVYCIEQRRPIRIGDFEQDIQLFLERPDVVSGQALADGSKAKQPMSLLYVPLLLQDTVIGMMTVQSFARNAYQQIHVDMLQTLAAYAAIAIDNARMVSALQTSHGELDHSHRQLIATQQKLVLQEKMVALGTLTAGVAHEINNPTNFIAGSAQNLEVQMTRFRDFLRDLAGADADPEVLAAFDQRLQPLHEQLANILEGAKRIRAIVLDLRQFTRLDEAERKSVPIAEPIRSTLNLIRTRFDRIEFRLDLAFNPTVECQPAKLGQVFMNLIVNACEAVEQPADGRAGVISIVTSRHADKLLQVEVADNGCGMTEATREHVFEPFFTTKAVGAGSGLGLAICHGIIKEHGGRIELDSKQDVGTVFRVMLPLDLGGSVDPEDPGQEGENQRK